MGSQIGKKEKATRKCKLLSGVIIENGVKFATQLSVLKFFKLPKTV